MADNGKEMLNRFLKVMFDRDASDLHLKVGVKPTMRVDGEMTPIREEPELDAEDLYDMLKAITTAEQLERYKAERELDFSYSLPGVSRFRVNYFMQRGLPGAVFRTIPLKILSIEDIGMPQILKSLAEKPQGFVLVTGPTGSGKSTTLAAMIDHINSTRRDHILTIEDPIEFLHRDKSCSVSQREVGQDTRSFDNALKSALREDPDVILVGEMRTLETISMAITAAETGHLVFATLHTTGAVQTIDRIIDVFPPGQQQQIRLQLSVTLQGVVSQTLVRKRSGKGRVVAHEIMTITPAIANLIRENKVFQITSMVQSGKDQGMHTLDQHLAELCARRLISFEDALAKCQDAQQFQKSMGRATAG